MRPGLSAAGLRNRRLRPSPGFISGPLLILMIVVSSCGGGTSDRASAGPGAFVGQTPSIEGVWTLSRTLVTCANPGGCAATPIQIRFDNCTDTQCTISRPDGVWQSSHSITRQGSTWTANIQDIGVACQGQRNTASIVIQFTVESTDVNGGVSRAKTINGSFEAAANSPKCANNAHASYRISGGRS